MLAIDLGQPVGAGADRLQTVRRAGPLLGLQIAQQVRWQNRERRQAQKWRKRRGQLAADAALANFIDQNVAPDRADAWVAGKAAILNRAQREQRIVNRQRRTIMPNNIIA